MQVALSWSAVSNAVSYNVYRSRTSGTGYYKINNTVGLSLTDICDNQNTYYVVTAVTNDGESLFSSQFTATLPSIPAAPTGLTGIVS